MTIRRASSRVSLSRSAVWTRRALWTCVCTLTVYQDGAHMLSTRVQSPVCQAALATRSGLRGRDQCSRTVCPGRIWATLSMSSSVTTPITG